MAVRQIEEIILKISLDDAKAKKGVDGITKSFDSGDKSASQFNKTLLKIGASLLAVAGGIRAIGKASDVALDFTKIGNVLTTVFEDSERVAEEWQFILRVSETLGLNNLKLAKSYARVAAAAKGTASEGKGARDILVGVSVAATALSLSADETEGALRAIVQIMSKGKVQAEELRGQLGERIPGAFSIAARAIGVTTQELDKMLETGKLLSDDFIPRFASQLRKEFSGGALQAANKEVATLNRISNDLNETWRRFGVVANSFLPFIANTIIPSVTSSLESLLDTSLDFAEKALPEILTVASGVFGGLGTLIDAFGDVAGAVFSFIGQGWNLLFTRITGDENWIDLITGFLTVAANAWPQLIANAFLTVAKVISDVLGKIQRFFSDVFFNIQQEGLNVAFVLGKLTEEEFEAGSVDIFERQLAAKKEQNFFEGLAESQAALIAENKETIQLFADAAVEKREEEQKSFKELIGNLRERIKNVFDVGVKVPGIDRRRQDALDIGRTGKAPKAVSPLTTAFQVGSKEASAFLAGTKVSLEQLTVQKKIEKNTRNATQTTIIVKG